jgi:hypothetical protein
MPQQIIFLIHLILGYVSCLLCFSVYVLPRLRSMERFEAQRVIVAFHSFRFFGLVFILPASSAPTCQLASPRSPPTATSQPGYWLYWPCSR